MKFLALIAIVAAADDAKKEAEVAEVAKLEANADCSKEGSVCGEGLCCGDATQKLEEGAEEKPESKAICFGKDKTEWVDEDDDSQKWSFKCRPSKSAHALAATAATLLASAYLMA